jgi:hypothetical protein
MLGNYEFVNMINSKVATSPAKQVGKGAGAVSRRHVSSVIIQQGLADVHVL